MGIRFSRLAITKVTECGQQQSAVKTLLLQRCELHKFLTAGQNALDQITRRRRLFCPTSHIVFKVKNFFESLKYYYDRQSNQQISGITLCQWTIVHSFCHVHKRNSVV